MEPLELQIEQREKVLRNNMIKDLQARLEIAKSLSEIQELLSIKGYSFGS